MSQRSELPDDLARLGRYLESAAAASVRRRNRRQAVMNVVGAVVLAVPFALAASASDLAPGDGIVPAPRAGAILFATQPPTNGFMVRHIPDEWLPPRTRQPCLDANDCRAPRRPSVEPAPAGNH